MAFDDKGSVLVQESLIMPCSEKEYTVDSAQKSGHLDLVELSEMRETTRCIYRIEGDALTICFSIKGERPDAFVSAVGSNRGLLNLKRALKE